MGISGNRIKRSYERICAMKYDRLGVEFVKIGAFLYAVRFIAAALMGPGLRDFDPKLFNLSYRCIGGELTFAAIVSVITGVLLIVAAFVQQYKKNNES